MPNNVVLLTLDHLTRYDGKIKTWTEGVYKIVEQQTAETGYLKTYKLQANGTDAASSVKINIPKDFVVKAAMVGTCATADVPVAGLVPGDKYIDLAINTVDSQDPSVDATHLYIAAKDLVSAYTAGAGIAISAGNEISVVALNASSAADAVGGITKTDYDAFKGAADTFSATAGTATAGTAAGNVTPYTKTITVASTDVGGTQTADAFHFDVEWKEYGNATPTSGQTAAAAGLMSGTDKDNLDALITALGNDVALATNADIDALFN